MRVQKSEGLHIFIVIIKRFIATAAARVWLKSTVTAGSKHKKIKHIHQIFEEKTKTKKNKNEYYAFCVCELTVRIYFRFADSLFSFLFLQTLTELKKLTEPVQQTATKSRMCLDGLILKFCMACTA